uniref:zinc-binding dehydrogenase n=2 Tax=Burkholderia cepacia TaxID=292 RepID=UPI002FDF1A03
TALPGTIQHWSLNLNPASHTEFRIPPDPWKLTVPNHTITSFYVGAYLALPELIQSTLTELIGLVLSGKVVLQPGTVLPLSQAAEAHRLLEGRQTTGKVVLQPWA